MRTVAYYYTLKESDGPEIISYQWHPHQRSVVTFPHLHLGGGAMVERAELQAAHLPTGRVSLEAFIRLLIEDFEVPTLRGDWEEALARSEEEFEADRSW